MTDLLPSLRNVVVSGGGVAADFFPCYYRQLLGGSGTLVLRRRQLTTARLQHEFQQVHQAGFGSLLSSTTRKLDLSGNQLTTPTISGTTNASTLADDGFSLFTILPRLDSLLLSSNRLTNFQWLQVTTTTAASLTHLDLSQNQIQGPLPEMMPLHFPYLEVLKLAGNQITYLPDTVHHWKRMRMLILGSECTGGNLLRELPASIGKMVALRELDISHNQLQQLPESIGAIGESLLSVSFYSNQLEQLPETILQWTNVRSLNLARNRIGFLPEALLDLNNLEMVDVSYNQLHLLSVEMTDFFRHRSVLLVGNPFDYKKAVDQESSRKCLMKSVSLPSLEMEEPSSSGTSQRRTALDSSLKQLASLSLLDVPLAPATCTAAPAAPSPFRSISVSQVVVDDDADTGVNDDNDSAIVMRDEASTEIGQKASEHFILDRPLSVVPTLLELSARTIIENRVVPHESMPQRLVALLCMRGGSCVVCQGVYVNEFHRHVQPMQHYIDSSQIPHRLTLCSQACLKRCSAGDVTTICDAVQSPGASATPNANSTAPMMLPFRRRLPSGKREKKLWKWKERLQHFHASLSHGDLTYDW